MLIQIKKIFHDNGRFIISFINIDYKNSDLFKSVLSAVFHC